MLITPSGQSGLNAASLAVLENKNVQELASIPLLGQEGKTVKKSTWDPLMRLKNAD